jgi:hypothetical protein
MGKMNDMYLEETYPHYEEYVDDIIYRHEIKERFITEVVDAMNQLPPTTTFTRVQVSDFLQTVLDGSK